MKFNKYLWDLYRESESGKSFLESGLEALPLSRDYKIDDFCYEVNSDYEILDNSEDIIVSIDIEELIIEFARENCVKSQEEANQLFIDIADYGLTDELSLEGRESDNFIYNFGGGVDDPKIYQDDIIQWVEAITLALHKVYPDFYFPYCFSRRFNELERIFRTFDIQMPDIPGKLQKRERALYYLEINSTLQEFRRKNNLSPIDLNAFLYDFSLKNLGGEQAKNNIELPEPSRVWFVIGFGRGRDANFLDSATKDSTEIWQGKLEMRRGDIVLMYCQSPRSYIHSIWRVIEDGFNDPYAYFYSQVKIGHPNIIPPIKFHEIASNEILGKKSIVKGKFQSATGATFSIEEYNEILNMIKKKGFSKNNLPKTANNELSLNVELKIEKDIEEKILEPLLLKLGYVESDWVRQFPVRMGRGQRNYPDYVLGGNAKPGEETAKILVECKYFIKGQGDLADTFKQAKSYALRLQAKIFMLADKQGVWVYEQKKNNFECSRFSYFNWIELTNPDKLHNLSLLIGKRVFENLK